MLIAAVQDELAARLRAVFENVYPRPPAAPLYPCAIVNFPRISTYHLDHAHSVTRTQWTVTLVAGRGDTDDALDKLAAWLSTEGDDAVKPHLEAKRAGCPWHRLALVESSSIDTNADSIEVSITLEIDA